jgi:hypothetical protein
MPNFINLLVRIVPSLKPVLEKHLDDNPELLPHLFMYYVVLWANSAMLALGGKEISGTEVESLLLTIEDCFGFANEEVDNLICVSFLEDLRGNEPGSSEVIANLGPKLRAFYRKYLEY